jgi:peptidoglycan hydrolase-like protein with peptidoglycan-binding domain
VTINIDRNFLDVGKGSWAAPENHCNATRISYPRYTRVVPGTTDTAMVKALKCLLKEKAGYAGRVNGTYNEGLRKALRAWQRSHGFTVSDAWNRANWMSLLIAGEAKVLKWGSAGAEVRRLQRALNAAHGAELGVNGVFKKATGDALRAYQRRVGLKVKGIAAPSTWRALRNGKR